LLKKTWGKNTKNIFDFSHDIVNLARKNGFEILIISGSPIKVIGLLGESLGIPIDHIIAGAIETKKGKYTSRIVSYPGSSQQKIEDLNDWASNHKVDIDWEKSIAMGDDERDFGLMSKVGKAIAINPNEKFRTMIADTKIIVTNTTNVLEIFSNIINK